MRLVGTHLGERVLKRPFVGLVAGLLLLSGVAAASVQADPADDALAKLNELSRQAEQTTEAMHSAQLDLDKKLEIQAAADRKHAEDAGALDAARAQLTTFQANVDKFAVATYMGGRTDGLSAMLSANSPQTLIDKLSVQRVMGERMATQMTDFRQASQQAVVAEAASAKSAADAKTAAEQAAAVRADLQSKQSQLQVQIAIVKSQYMALTPDQRVAGPLDTSPSPRDRG